MLGWQTRNEEMDDRWELKTPPGSTFKLLILVLRAREGDRDGSLSLPPLYLKEEFSIYQKLCDLLDLREKVDKSDTNKMAASVNEGTTCFHRTSILWKSVTRIDTNSDRSLYTFPDQCIDMYKLSDLYTFTQDEKDNTLRTSRGTLHLYELVGESYISLNRSGNVYNSMLVGERVFGQSPFGEDSFGKYTWCLNESESITPGRDKIW